MAEELIINQSKNKQEQYRDLYPQIAALVADENNQVANMANVAAALKQAFNFFWVGFYIVEGDQLVLGPFQGPIACTRISKGKGVCGKAWVDQKTVIVDDVDKFPGHIACSSASRSEIVVPGITGGSKVNFVLDVDSDQLSDFDTYDKAGLEAIVALLC